MYIRLIARASRHTHHAHAAELRCAEVVALHKLRAQRGRDERKLRHALLLHEIEKLRRLESFAYDNGSACADGLHRSGEAAYVEHRRVVEENIVLAHRRLQHIAALQLIRQTLIAVRCRLGFARRSARKNVQDYIALGALHRLGRFALRQLCQLRERYASEAAPGELFRLVQPLSHCVVVYEQLCIHVACEPCKLLRVLAVVQRGAYRARSEQREIQAEHIR